MKAIINFILNLWEYLFGKKKRLKKEAKDYQEIVENGYNISFDKSVNEMAAIDKVNEMEKEENISAHITLEEATYSRTAEKRGIDNQPNDGQFVRMALLAENIFEPLRAAITKASGKDTPIHITSFFRSDKLNKAIGGASNSQHKANYGSAIDLDIDGRYSNIINATLFYYIKDNLHFDQLIWEKGNMINPSWVHVSYVGEGKNRKEVLRMYKDEDNKSVYIPFDL